VDPAAEPGPLGAAHRRSAVQGERGAWEAMLLVIELRVERLVLCGVASYIFLG
jgi:hypothetical protein